MRFDFSHPYLLFLALLVPLAIWAMVARRKNRPGLLFPSTERGAEAARRQGKSHSIVYLAAMRALALCALVFAIAGPRFGNDTKEIQSSGIDIMLCVDVSGSMLALDLDWQGSRATRLEVVKGVIDDFIDRRPSDRIGMIAFGNDPYLVSPVTLEHDWLRQNIKRIEVGVVSTGTSIGPPLGMAINRLKADKESKSRIAILLTDGNDSVQASVPPVKYAEAAKALGIKVYTIAVGRGGVVPSYYVGRDGKIARNMFGQPEIRQFDYPLDEEVLREMAEKGGGQFFRARDLNDLKRIYGEIDKLEKTEVTLTYHTEYEDAWLYPLCAGLALLVLEQLLAYSFFRALP
jgi:Ca-activated chloride channel homolog